MSTWTGCFLPQRRWTLQRILGTKRQSVFCNHVTAIDCRSSTLRAQQLNFRKHGKRHSFSPWGSRGSLQARDAWPQHRELVQVKLVFCL